MAAIVSTLLEVGDALAVPVSVHSVTERRDVRLDRATPDGRRIKRIDVPEPEPDALTLTVEDLRRDKEGGIIQQQFDGEPMRGVWQDDEFHEIAPTDLEAIEDETYLSTIRVDHFIPLKVLNDSRAWARVTGAYYLTAGRGASTKPLVLLKEALTAEKVAGVAKVMFRRSGRQKLALIHAGHDGLLVSTLHFAHDFQRARSEVSLSHPDGISKEAVKMAREYVAVKTTDSATLLDEFADESLPLKERLVAEALAGKPIKRTKAKATVATPTTDDVLLERLRESVEQAAKAKAKTNGRKAKPKVRA